MSDMTWAETLWMPEEEALEGRAKLMTSEHWIRAMFLASAVEILRREAGAAAADEAEAEAGVKTESMGAMQKVPLVDFNRLQRAIGKRLGPLHGGWPGGVARIGASAVEIFFESVAGRTMILLGGKNPHRLMTAAPNAYPVTFSDGGKRSYTKIGENEGVFTFEHDLVGPCHEIGVFSYAIKAACGIDIRTRLEQAALTDFKLFVSW